MKNKLLQTIIMMSNYAFIGIFLQMILYNLVLASISDAQSQIKSVREVYVEVEFKNAPLKEVFSTIEDLTDYNFVFQNIDVDNSLRIDLKKQKIYVAKLLMKISKDAKISFKQLNENITVKKTINNNKGQEIEVIIQGITITGKVTSAEDTDGLPGVNVIVKGTAQGTVTDVEGNYKLDVPDEESILVFSSVGFVKEEVIVGTQTVIDFILTLDITALGEIVVIGYGTQKKINLTGSVDVIAGEALSNRPAANVGQLLQGISPNLNIGIPTQGGEPGKNNTINIRGVGSLTGSSSPLILVDGVQMDPNDLNPDDIESVTVLKDAAASAIYGSRAPFGVVLITTKKGSKNQKISVSYSNNFGFASPIGLPEWVSSLTLATAFNQANANAGQSPKFPDEQMDRIRAYNNDPTLPEYDPNVPWSSLWRGRHLGNANYEYNSIYWKNNSLRQKHDLSIQGGGEKTQYYVSGSFYDQDGLYNYGYDSYKRFNFLSNVSSQATDWLRFDFNTKFSKNEKDYPMPMGSWDDRYYILRSMNTFWPTMPMTNIGEDPSSVTYYNNPIIRSMESSGRDISESNETILTFGTEIEPIKGWKTNLGYSYTYFNRRRTQNGIPIPVHLPGGVVGYLGNNPSVYSVNMDYNTYTIFNARTSYEESINENHNFILMVGYEQENRFRSNLFGSRNELITVSVPSVSTSTGNAVQLDDAISHWATQAVFGRFAYNFKEKYLFEVNARYNGSSRFAKENRWGFFPSVSAGYNISKEDFWTPLQGIVDELKIRSSYGSLGNQNVPNYLYLSNVPVNSNLEYIIDDQRPLYAQSPGIVSSNLTWETVTTFNIGIDAGFLNNRLSTTFDWFNRTTTDMFGPAGTLPEILGTNAPQENNADLETKGWELSIAWNDNIGTDFSYNARFIIGDSKTTVIKYNNEAGLIDDWYNGKVLGEIWGYTSDGLIQTEGEDMPDQSFFFNKWGPGDMKFKDLDGDSNGDGVSDGGPDGIINDGERTLDSHGDLTVIGNTLPRFNYGIFLGANWKGFDFNIFFQGVGKRNIAPRSGWQGANFWGVGYNPNNTGMFKEGHLDYWRPADDNSILGPNTDSYYPKPYFSRTESPKSRQIQTKYLLNAGYMRLKSLQIGYVLPGEITKKVHIQKLRLYITGENLFTITKLTKLLDPETAAIAGLSGGQGEEGIGRVYPLSRVISFGLNLTF